MFQNYLKIALRSIARYKAYSIINISGLAIGMASSILIMLWVQHELSYDKWLTHSGQIYRINSAAGDFKTALSPAGMAEAVQATLPMIRNTVRIDGPNNFLITAGDRRFEEHGVIFADSTFLQVFTFPLVKGDAHTALQRPDGILLTEEMAVKYFGHDNPMGKVLRMGNNSNKIVTGVLANIPANSHLHPDFVLPATEPEQRGHMAENPWGNFSFYTYVQLDEHFDGSKTAIAGLEKQLNVLFKQHEKNLKIDFTLLPLTSIHLHSNLQMEQAGGGNIQYVKIFFIVAIFIMVVACINFMNLATARSARRAKEVGLRKVVGAVRWQLMGQFLGEALLISFFALVVAIIIVWLVLPSFNQLAGKTLTVSIWNGKLLTTLVGIAFVTGLISGSYPALFLSGFQPVKVLKGSLRGLGGNRLFRNGLVVVQFVVSIVLLIGTIVIYNQLRYIKNRNLGYDKENLVSMPMKGQLWNKKQALYDALAQDPATSQFTVTSDLPTNTTSGTIDVEWPGRDPRKQIVFPSLDVSESFFTVFNMKMLNGRGFSKVFNDSSNFILNETAARIMGMTPANAVGQQISFQSKKGTIVGVVADFNFKPIQRAIEPLVMRLNRWGGVVVVKTRPGATQAAIKHLEKLSQSLEPAYPFTYGFLDQQLAIQYKGEQQMGHIFNLFASLAVFISCLGLYGLSAYIAEQRTKEIGVRKVLGASLFNILRLLSGDFTRLIVIAMVIAVPLAWCAVNQWLQSFAYHIQVGWAVFFMAPLAALFIAWATVSYESIKAGVANPVKSLRSE